MINIKALFLRDNQTLTLEETPKPILQNNYDVIIKVTATSICGSDLHFLRNEIPCIPNFIIGHEFVGIIDDLGDGVKRFKKGDRVSIPAAPYCSSCYNCKAGRVYACSDSNGMFGGGKIAGDLPGAQAEYVRVPYADFCLVKIPDQLNDNQVLLVGDVLSTGLFAVTNGNIQPGDEVAIFGGGPVGLCAVACATLFSPSKIILVDFEENRLNIGLKLGATHIVHAQDDSIVKKIKKLSSNNGVDLAIDAVGLPATLQNCASVTKRGGTISIVGLGPYNIEFPMGKFFQKNLTLKVGYVPLTQMNNLMKLIELGKLDLTPLITHEFPLDKIIQAYDIFENKKDNCIKVMITP